MPELTPFLNSLEVAAGTFSSWAWGPWLLILLLGGGSYLLLLSRLLPFAQIGESVALLMGKHDEQRAPGDLTHFQALSSALAGTIGMGNIAGVAVAIEMGGPGAVFWMWMTAFVGIATKFFTCTLAVMYRGTDSLGRTRGGPMYMITQGLSSRWKFLATWFCIAGMIGCLPAFQANQLVQILRDVSLPALNSGLSAQAQISTTAFNLTAGVAIAALIGTVVIGGLPRIAWIAARLVPVMTLLFVGGTALILLTHASAVPSMLWLIFSDAFTGEAAAGGALGTVIAVGVQRGAYSNEAGIGTETLAHGTARTQEPVREGLVAMVGPIIDTLLVCSATALAILVTGVWQTSDASGVSLTAAAFAEAFGAPGTALVMLCVFAFATTTMLTQSFYGCTCFNFLFGAHIESAYKAFYVAMIAVAAVISLNTAIGIIDGCFALMAIPTMLATLILAPQVMAQARRYWHAAAP